MSKRLDSLLAFLERDPDDAFTRYAVALEYVSSGDRPKGEEYLRETIRRDPGYVPAYHMLGQLLGNDSRYDEAAAAYTEGIRRAAIAGDNHARNEMEQELEELQEEL